MWLLTLVGVNVAGSKRGAAQAYNAFADRYRTQDREARIATAVPRDSQL